MQPGAGNGRGGDGGGTVWMEEGIVRGSGDESCQ